MKACVLFLLLSLMLAALAGAAGKPAYHLPPEDWRLNHGKRLRLPDKLTPGPVFFDLGECLLCHRPQESCNVCHRRLGLSLVERKRGR